MHQFVITCVSLLLIYCFAVASNFGVNVAARYPRTVTEPSKKARQPSSDEDDGLHFYLREGTDQLNPAAALQTGYFKTFEKVTPHFVARAWLGGRFAGEQVFHGRSTDRRQVNVPMRYLVQQTAPDLVISKDGTGPALLSREPELRAPDLDLKPVDYVFTVERSYEAVDDPKDVSRDAQGVWHIKAGARVRVRLTMVAPVRRYHVALVELCRRALKR